MNTRIPSHLVPPLERRHLLRRHEAGGITIDRAATSGAKPGIHVTYGRLAPGVTLRTTNPDSQDDLLEASPDGGIRIKLDE